MQKTSGCASGYSVELSSLYCGSIATIAIETGANTGVSSLNAGLDAKSY
jgi:hypothetical protein